VGTYFDLSADPVIASPGKQDAVRIFCLSDAPQFHTLFAFMISKTTGLSAVLTGANGGLGLPLTAALAAAGMDLLLVAYPGVGLDEACAVARRHGVKATSLVADLREESGRTLTLQTARERLGRVDILVNNAGVEYSAPYHELSVTQIREVMSVNLEAPMMLTRGVLAEMLQRGLGHIVNISSLAGKAGPACQEPYAASKAALCAFTYSLRNTYRGTGVSASVITPGFVDAGIYSRMKTRTGRSAPPLLAACSPDRVAAAVMRGITRDRAEIIVNRYPMRPLLACMALWSGFAERVPQWTGANDLFRTAAKAEAPSKG